MAEIISGTEFAATLVASLRIQAAEFTAMHDLPPTLAVILVGTDPASAIYVRRKIAMSNKVGIRSIERRFDASLTEQVLLEVIAQLNADASVHGILVQLPLPAQINSHQSPRCH